MEEEKIKIGTWVDVHENDEYIGYGKVAKIENILLKRYPYLIIFQNNNQAPREQWFDENELTIIPDQEMFIKLLAEDK